MFDSSFFITVFLVQPLTRRILTRKPKVHSLNRRILHAVIFLAAVTVAQIVYSQSGTWGRNHFEVMELSRTASVADVKKQYKKLAVKYHPDKFEGTEEEANEKFIAIQKAYGVLSNYKTKDFYDKYGDEGLAWLEKADVDQDKEASQSIAIFYIIWAVVTYLLTLPHSQTSSRSYAYGGLALLLAIEVGMRYSNLDLPIPFMSSTCIFQKVQMLRLCYPGIIHGANSILSMTYVDIERISYLALRNILHTNANIHQRMKVIEAELSKKKVLRYIDGEGVAADLNAPNKEIADSIPPEPSKFKLPGWVWFIVLYFIFNYVLKSGGSDE